MVYENDRIEYPEPNEDKGLRERNVELRSALHYALDTLESCECWQETKIGVKCRKNQSEKCRRCKAIDKIKEVE